MKHSSFKAEGITARIQALRFRILGRACMLVRNSVNTLC
jgi:hypothetical protein